MATGFAVCCELQNGWTDQIAHQIRVASEEMKLTFRRIKVWLWNITHAITCAAFKKRELLRFHKHASNKRNNECLCILHERYIYDTTWRDISIARQGKSYGQRYGQRPSSLANCSGVNYGVNTRTQQWQYHQKKSAMTISSKQISIVLNSHLFAQFIVKHCKKGFREIFQMSPAEKHVCIWNPWENQLFSVLSKFLIIKKKFTLMF